MFEVAVSVYPGSHKAKSRSKVDFLGPFSQMLEGHMIH